MTGVDEFFETFFPKGEKQICGKGDAEQNGNRKETDQVEDEGEEINEKEKVEGNNAGFYITSTIGC